VVKVVLTVGLVACNLRVVVYRRILGTSNHGQVMECTIK